VSRTLKYDFYSSFLDSFNLQREFVGNVVMPDTRAVFQDRSNDCSVIMQQVVRG